MRNTVLLLLAMLALSGCGAAPVVATHAAPTASPGYRQSVLADGPVAFWPMDESSGTLMRDASGNGHDGAYQGGVAMGQAGPIKAAASAAIGLDGMTGWATVPDASGLQLSTISIELWINKRTDVEFGPYVTKNFTPGGGSGTGWFQLLNDHHDGHLQFRVGSDDPAIASAATLALNTWYDVVVTYDGTTVRLYLNGKLDSSAAIAADPKQSSDPIEIGRRSDGLLNNVALSGLAIYPTALSADRIAEHWQAASSAR